MSEPLVVTRPLGGSKLAARGASRGACPRGGSPPRPRGAAGWRRPRPRCAPSSRRTTGIDALAPAFRASGAAAERLARSAGGRGIVVTTGQQPGLFGGPMYTWSKALSALALADALERATGVPVAPVFWAATDDADFDEASVTSVARDGEVRAARDAGAGTGGHADGDTPLGDVARARARAARRESGSAVDRARARRGARARTARARRSASAYVALLRARARAARDRGARRLASGGRRARRGRRSSARCARAPAVDAALRQREAELARRGLRAEGAAREGALARVRACAMACGGGSRSPRRRDADGGDRSSRTCSCARWSSGRSCRRRRISAGPGEIAYFAQVSAVAAALGDAAAGRAAALVGDDHRAARAAHPRASTGSPWTTCAIRTPPTRASRAARCRTRWRRRSRTIARRSTARTARSRRGRRGDAARWCRTRCSKGRAGTSRTGSTASSGASSRR